jgi:hypothetical protein
MGDIDANTLTALLAAGALYSTLMPSLAEVRRASCDGETADDVRNGYVVGGVVLVGIGAMISAHSNTPRPLHLMIGLSLLLAGAYELTLRRRGAACAPAMAEPGPRKLGRYGM